MSEGQPTRILSLGSRFVRVPFVERELAHGRRFVQAVNGEAPTQLSGSAPLIWDLLDEYPTIGAITAMLQQRYTDPPEIIGAGVQAALLSFLQAALVEERP
jgi:hypothetical protein